MRVRVPLTTTVPTIAAIVLAALSPMPAAAQGGGAVRPRVAAAPAADRPAADRVAVAIRSEAGGWMGRVYAERGYRPLWWSDGRIGKSADVLIGYLSSADRDGLKPSSYKVDDLREAIAAAHGGDPRLAAEAEIALSKAFVRYVRDQRRVRDVGMAYADPALKPKRPKSDTVLRAAAFPKSFARYVAEMGWMSPHYVRMRTLMGQALADGMGEGDIARLRRNLERARVLPGAWTRHVVVDASSGRLWFYEAGEQAGTMKVVVGTRETQTPLLAGTLQWAIVNPYWNIPTYLVRKNVAPKVLAGRSLVSLRMEALSDWSAAARPLPASSIDWHAVASGAQEIRLRELPGPVNSMGRVKFLFPNDEGIYLHDTPNRDLLKAEDRHFSNGCIRLEQASVLAKWLMGKPLGTASRKPEQAVPLPVPVPVYLTYLTPLATKTRVAFRPDVYGHDG